MSRRVGINIARLNYAFIYEQKGGIDWDNIDWDILSKSCI
jgi:hypothetical protein